MLAAFLANLAEAFTSPRASARGIISRGGDMQQATLLCCFAFCIHIIGGNLTSLALDGSLPETNPLLRLTTLGLQLLQFLALTFGAHLACARFGGTASRHQIGMLTGWHAVVNSVMAPIQLVAVRAVETPESSGLLLLLPITLGISVWIYSAFLAEASGFKRLGPVVLGVIAGFVFLGAAMQVLLGPLLAMPEGAAPAL